METPAPPPPVTPDPPAEPTPPPPVEPSGPTIGRVLELARLLEPTWRAIRPAGLVCEGDAGQGAGNSAGAGDAGQGQGAGTGDGQGGQGAQGDAGQGAGAGDAGQGAGGDAGEETVTMTKAERDALQQAVAEANRTARETKRELEALKSQGQTDAERNADAAQRLERVTAAVSTQTLKAEVQAAAERLRFKSPSLAANVIDLAGLDVDVDIDGDEPKVTVPPATKTMIESRLTEAGKKYTELLNPEGARQFAGAGAGGTGGTGQGGDGGDGNAAMNAAIRSAAGRA